MSLAQAVAQSTELDRAAGGTPDLRVLGSERGWITKRPDAGEHDVCGRLQHLPGVLHIAGRDRGLNPTDAVKVPELQVPSDEHPAREDAEQHEFDQAELPESHPSPRKLTTVVGLAQSSISETSLPGCTIRTKTTTV